MLHLNKLYPNHMIQDKREMTKIFRTANAIAIEFKEQLQIGQRICIKGNVGNLKYRVAFNSVIEMTYVNNNATRDIVPLSESIVNKSIL